MREFSCVDVHVLPVKRLLLPASQQLVSSRAPGPAFAVHVWLVSVLGVYAWIDVDRCFWRLACARLFALSWLLPLTAVDCL